MKAVRCWCLATVLAVAFVVDGTSAEADSSQPDIELSVYGSGSFKSGLTVGTAPITVDKSEQRVMVSGAKAEVSFHDRSEVACSASKRWALYSTAKSLRTHRPSGQGGFIISEEMSRFLKDLNVGGVIRTKTLTLQGVGPRKAESEDGEPMLIGNKLLSHLKMGYHEGHSWVQSVGSHLVLNPSKNPISIGTTKSKKSLTVGGHARATDKLIVGGSDGSTSLSATHLRFGYGGGWYMTDKNYVRTVGNIPSYTKGGGKFMGNVGIGTLPKFPIFRLQVHGDVKSATGAVLVTDKADKGFTISQIKEGALLRSWNSGTKKHEAMLVEAAPLLIQPRSGIVLFGTTVRKKRMHLHIRGNLYIHGHMFAMKNLHVRDHANLKHLLMPSISLKNKPQSPDGDTLVMGHMKKKKKGASEPSPWETGKPKKVITGINLRFGFHQDYTWIQVHGKRKAHHEPLALNPLGNTVSIGSVKPDRRHNLYANGNGYVLGTLYVKMNGAKKSMSAAEVRDYAELSSNDAMDALRTSEVRMGLLRKTEEQQSELLRSRLTLINVPEKLKHSQINDEVSVNRMTHMFHKVLAKQAEHMAVQDATLKTQMETILRLQTQLSALRK
jgi:hypothetical protein